MESGKRGDGRGRTLAGWKGINTDKWSDGMTGWQNDTRDVLLSDVVLFTTN